MIVAEPRTQASNGTTQAGPDLRRAVREYVRVYASLHGRPKAAEDLGVSRHTLWRFLAKGHTGRSIPRAVLDRVGRSVKEVEAARETLIAEVRLWEATERRLADNGRAKGSAPGVIRLSLGLEDSLRLLCAAPLATVDELSRFGRVPASTLRDRLKKLAERGLVDSVSHHLSVLGPHPKRRYFPTEQGIVAGGRIEHGTEYFLTEYPVSKQWFRLLAERLDAVAVLYRVAAMIADADPHRKPVRVDHYRQGPYDMLLTLSGGRSIGIIRQGETLPTSKLRYRFRSAERMRSRDRPFVTLVLTYADQATRRAIRSLGDPSEHRRTFVATEGELLAGDHTGAVWQQCGSGLGENPPVRIDGDTSLADILTWMHRLLDKSYSFLRDRPKANPEALYPSSVKTAMPEPTQQLAPALSVQLTRAEKGRPRPAGRMAPVHPGAARRTDGRRHLAPGQPDAALPDPARPRESGRAPAHAHRRGVDVPGPQGPCSRWTDPRSLDSRYLLPRHLRRDGPARPGIPASAPRRRHRLRRFPVRRGRPIQGL